jgi:hypothetical protein
MALTSIVPCYRTRNTASPLGTLTIWSPTKKYMRHLEVLLFHEPTIYSLTKRESELEEVPTLKNYTVAETTSPLTFNPDNKLTKIQKWQDNARKTNNIL